MDTFLKVLICKYQSADSTKTKPLTKLRENKIERKKTGLIKRRGKKAFTEQDTFNN